MNPRDRRLRRGIAALVLLHALACTFFPASLWGVSALAAWPSAVVWIWTALALCALVLSTRLAGRATPLPFPGRRGSLLIALLSAAPFWCLRERTHFFGDGALLLRDGGLSESISRAPLLVHLTTATVQAGKRSGLGTEASLEALSVAAGVCAVFALLRLAATLTADRGGRFLAAALLLTAGSMQLFFGHVEYYAPLAAAVITYWVLACRALVRGGITWPTWLVLAVLPSLHLGTLALVPAQIGLGIMRWRQGARRDVGFGVLGASAIFLLVTRLSPHTGAALSLGVNLRRYLEPYFATTSAKHDFGLFAPAHGLAVLNDVLLVAPIALAAIPALWTERQRGIDPVQRFLGLVALGGLVLSFGFHRELGPYRDWDLLAWNGFAMLAWTAARLTRPHPGPQRIATLLVLVGGLYHLVPWVALQVSPAAALRQVRLVLSNDQQWSPHARGYMHEELAIFLRQRGDDAGSLREYEAAVAANPADARYHVGLGTRWVQRGELDRAAVEFEAAVHARPDYAPAHNDLAYVLARLGRDLERARQHAAFAVHAEPRNADYLATQARVLLALGDTTGAHRSALAALQERPGMPEAMGILDAVAPPAPPP